jgi:hypothetical protein
LVRCITGLDAAFDAGAALVDFTVAVVVLAVTKGQICGIALGVCVGVTEGAVFHQARVFPRVAVVTVWTEA